ncbi:50S ribosomal protein L6 [bacterium]|nr:50S ribosomal protein L6 [bacterium]
MSRIGRQPVVIPDGVEVEIKRGNIVEVKGPKGELSQQVDSLIKPKIEDSQVIFERKANHKQARAYHGLFRNLINNMVIGVSQGFERQLYVIGVGYKVEDQPGGIMLSLGYSHQIYFRKPEGIEFEVDRPKRRTIAEGTKELLIGTITVKGVDKQLVGQVSAKLRSLRPPDNYKGKGIRYKGEEVHLKAGKAVI